MNDDYAILDHIEALKLDMVNIECSLGYLNQRLVELEQILSKKQAGA